MDDSEGLQEVLDIIQEINDDGSVPRNIKKILNELRDLFGNSDSEFKVKVDTASQMIEELSLNPNLPSHARTQIWNISSVLEDLSKD